MFKRVAILALLLVGVMLAGSRTGSKTYTIMLADQAMAGDAQLKAGEYQLKLDGSQVVLIDKKGKRIETTGTVETAERKFEETAIATGKADGTNRILSIQLGGSRNRVVFQSGSL